MRTLLLHDITPDESVAEVLRAAGHEVVRCIEAGEHAFPCKGIDGACPLDGTVDVAVVVHDKPATSLNLGELGAICALRDGIPLVLAGNHTHSPLQERCDAVAVDVEDVPAACERAVLAAARKASAVVTVGAGVEATVTRRGDTVRVRLPAGASEQQAVHAHQAATKTFPRARTIDVTTF